MDTTELFCDIDDFRKVFIPSWVKSMLPANRPTRNRKFSMSPAES